MSRYGLLVRPEEIDPIARAAVDDLTARQFHAWAVKGTRRDLAEVIGRVERLWGDRAALAFRTATSQHFAGVVFATGDRCDEEADRVVALLQDALTQDNDLRIACDPGPAVPAGDGNEESA